MLLSILFLSLSKLKNFQQNKVFYFVVFLKGFYLRQASNRITPEDHKSIFKV